MLSIKRLAAVVVLTTGLLLSTSPESAAKAKTKKRDIGPLTRVELREAERRLSEMGYWTGRVDGVIDRFTQTALIAFQKWEGRKVTGRLTRSELNAIRDAPSPEPRDTGYKHIEVDLDRQVLLLTDDEGAITKILPVSTGSGKHYKEKRMSGLAYTPRGRFRIYGKISGWRRSPLGLLFYPNYFSDGLAIHGNPEVPHTPRSHGCVRIPMFAAEEISRQLPVGTIVLIYDSQSFVSAKDWAQKDKQKEISNDR
ncbi:MAG TPA: L,D-transpeptidase family protein [Pyrinomonadaceae bacterium]|nr:L,D-transpeptidase family protein [Pyrinomonadaceae bacterium]